MHTVRLKKQGKARKRMARAGIRLAEHRASSSGIEGRVLASQSEGYARPSVSTLTLKKKERQIKESFKQASINQTVAGFEPNKPGSALRTSICQSASAFWPWVRGVIFMNLLPLKRTSHGAPYRIQSLSYLWMLKLWNQSSWRKRGICTECVQFSLPCHFLNKLHSNHIVTDFPCDRYYNLELCRSPDLHTPSD